MTAPVPAPLSASQRARFRKAFREAYASIDKSALGAVYAKYQELYGVSRGTLLDVLVDDQRRNPKEYTELRKLRQARYKDAASPKSQKKQGKRRKKPKQKIEKSGGTSVWTVSGGLPGLGRGHR
ncbi:hypothetical protein [Mycolicibacterium farcinogenes]|uniref:Uncharacterized protein n=1 Tax=Mycolicibacterium farcinogenes TaxID=1802 RepID=A0ACD1FL19_MYCFR|nr:hypothetical protein [Mycolicibacterium farcinogenes]QZH67691.1 hypothetical protein K6L26_08690 [Mycolicibacterium farcinogenes]